jgi:methyl-accepting chemotaxis protein
VSAARVDQRAAAAEVAQSAASMRVQADQTARALKEQTRAVRDISNAADNAARQVKTITLANRGHSQAVVSVLGEVAEARRITERNAGGVKQTRDGTADLLRNAEALTTIVRDFVNTAH